MSVAVHRCSSDIHPCRRGKSLVRSRENGYFGRLITVIPSTPRPNGFGRESTAMKPEMVSSASWRRSKTVTRNGRRASPRMRGTSRLTARTSGIRRCIENPPGMSKLRLHATRLRTSLSTAPAITPVNRNGCLSTGSSSPSVVFGFLDVMPKPPCFTIRNGSRSTYATRMMSRLTSLLTPF